LPSAAAITAEFKCYVRLPNPNVPNAKVQTVKLSTVKLSTPVKIPI
jgi:hypothetical protein